jgi:hypothetical protein
MQPRPVKPAFRLACTFCAKFTMRAGAMLPLRRERAM